MRSQSGFKTDGDITRKVIIYSEYNLDVLLYYLWVYYSNFIIYYSILLSYYNNRDQVNDEQSGFKTIWDITRKVIIYSGYYYIFVELFLLYY